MKTRVVTGLARAGVRIRRYVHPEQLPMHAKFVVVDRLGERTAWFGSLNYNLSSRYLNQEVLARTAASGLIESFERRFRVISAEADRYETARPSGHIPPGA